jgi:hypothetical protein
MNTETSTELLLFMITVFGLPAVIHVVEGYGLMEGWKRNVLVT